METPEETKNMRAKIGKCKGKVKHSKVEDTPGDRKECHFPDKQIQREYKEKAFRAGRSHSLNNVTCYTPDIFVEGSIEYYRLHCTHAGLFQCKVTGLVFKMKAEGDVIYRTVPWDQSRLSCLGKRPAGPLFDIECLQGSVCQLHLPHCEIISAGGGNSLSVGHVKEGVIELNDPHEITEMYVIINVTGFSGHGLVTDANSNNPMDALVPLFYKPPTCNSDPVSVLNVLLLPGNVVLSEVVNERRKTSEEIYIETPSCTLIPNQEYTLSTSPQDDSITIEPNTTRPFKVNSYQNNYTFTYRVTLERRITHLRFFLTASLNSDSVWDSCRVRLTYINSTVPFVQVQHPLNDTAEDILHSVRTSFIQRVSIPVLNLLVDKLLEQKVLNDAEMKTAAAKQLGYEKACFVIDTVKSKGPIASSSMISLLCEMDPFLSDYLGLSNTRHRNGPESTPQPRRSICQSKGSADGPSKKKTQYTGMQTRKRRIES